MASQWVIEFDYRSDGGPRLVGPFFLRQRAEAHADVLRGSGADWEATWSIVPLATIGESLGARGTEAGVSGR